MPYQILAAILIQLGQPHPVKQQILCFEYALAARLQPFAVCHLADEALAMIMAGTVAAIITAVDPGGSLAGDIGRWGGQLHIVRDVPQQPRLRRLAERMYRSGLDTGQIAAILEVSPERIRQHRNPPRE